MAVLTKQQLYQWPCPGMEMFSGQYANLSTTLADVRGDIWPRYK